jgi:hypothetical protein
MAEADILNDFPDITRKISAPVLNSLLIMNVSRRLAVALPQENGCTTGKTHSVIAALNLSASSTAGSWADSSNQMNRFDGAESASK